MLSFYYVVLLFLFCVNCVFSPQFFFQIDFYYPQFGSLNLLYFSFSATIRECIVCLFECDLTILTKMNFDELDIEPKNEPSADCKSSSKDSEILSKVIELGVFKLFSSICLFVWSCTANR